MTSGSVLQEYVGILKVYTPNKRASKYMDKRTELKRKMGKSIIVVVDCNIPFSERTVTERTVERKIKR